ncbi:autotransporter assembly complex protein TamA [Coralloluteibacterium stylophorae]|uniref:Translocation and assembly module subunit TamA n=1 Tax=Coralloluteibacterium stylophorae TaxID=1776034 RepID=A0A8J7VS28_9GAMM|nr:autotransporter assembly complex family protein [Coralloluteibacterium stylophorae]MBS7457130.1 outer membrane protein assembly factor [Coralloluteibacterium stylophorae]
MPSLRRIPAAAAVLFFAAGATPASAVELVGVDVRGIDDATERDNVVNSLSLNKLDEARRRDLRPGRLAYLLRVAPEEVRTALEPYGYYDTEVEIDEQRSGDEVRVVVTVDQGEPVTVTRRIARINGEATEDPALAPPLVNLEPRPGDVLDHRRYEAGKTRINRVMNERGYFDHRLVTHQVLVTRASHSADIELVWESGQRYEMGAAEFNGHVFRPGLLEQLVTWEPGDPYLQRHLLTLNSALVDLDYFGFVDVQPAPERAEPGGQVPIVVDLTMAKRTAYSAGLSYGTDSGAGVRLGMNRRYVNDRGHKLEAEADIAQYRRSIATSYRIPAFAWVNGWWTLAANLREEEDVTTGDTVTIPFRTFEIIGSRNGRIGNWNLVASMHLQRERFEIVDDVRFANLFYPELSAQYARADDRLYPRNGFGFSADVRSGPEFLGSDVAFSQLEVGANWVRGFGERNRVLVRGRIGTTTSDDFDNLPPSMRFYAGGDRSVRGYAYREIGPRVYDPERERDLVIGGKHLAVASVEYERMITESWGGAVFVDAGDAFNSRDDFDAKVGVGFGVRWRSPVGPVRVDIGHGLDDPESAFQLHINIGTDL